MSHVRERQQVRPVAAADRGRVPEAAMEAAVHLDVERHAGPIDRRIFGGFAEHIGRVVYGGLYDPGNPLSDERGFRRDVLAALRPLGMPVIRYPGGNFVSAYDWRDGVGPLEERRARPDFAWKSIEPNTFGTDEFLGWCSALEAAPYMVVNLGTLDAREAAEWIEYCNLPGGTYWSDRRIAHGHPAPYGVKLWGLGNEMDGRWQAGHVPAHVYARKAHTAAQLMKGLDPNIELVLAGSTGSVMPTYMEWDRVVLEYCWHYVDYISVHNYSRNDASDTPRFLAEGTHIDRVIEDCAALIRYVQARQQSRKRVYLAFDEWNVWYRANERGQQWWTQAPPLLEEEYNLEDALVVAQYLNSFIRHADVVKIGCLAQIVNVLAPVLTRPEGVLLQSTYHPFALYAGHARGLALTPVVHAPVYEAGDRGEVPVLDATATFDEEAGRAALFLVNRDTERDLAAVVEFRGCTVGEVLEVTTLTGSDPKAVNTWEEPDVVRPIRGAAHATGTNALRVHVPALGLTVVSVQAALQ